MDSFNLVNRLQYLLAELIIKPANVISICVIKLKRKEINIKLKLSTNIFVRSN